MTASTLITDYMGSGLFANRPTTPPVAAGSVAIYYATDVGTLFTWSGTAWLRMGPVPTLTQAQLQADITLSSSSSATIRSWSSGDIILDEAGAWAAGNPTRFTTPSWAKRARFTIYPVWAANLTNYRYAFLNLNGSTKHVYRMRATNETTWPLITPWLRSLTSGTDYFEIGFAQDSGGNLNLTGGAAANADAAFVQIEWAP